MHDPPEASADPPPYHRQWLHALERDTTVPSTAMQVARVLADHAPEDDREHTWVTRIRLRAQTHLAYDAIHTALAYLVGHVWLIPQDHIRGQRIIYHLAFGLPGKKRARPRHPDRER